MSARHRLLFNWLSRVESIEEIVKRRRAPGIMRMLAQMARRAPGLYSQKTSYGDIELALCTIMRLYGRQLTNERK